MKSLMLALMFVSSLVNAATTAASKEAILELQLKGDSGSSIASLNKKLKEQGEKLLPSSIEISSKMNSDDVSKLKDRLNELVDKASPNEMIETSAYGDLINGRATCFRGEASKVADIYANMVDIFVSDQFTILAISTKKTDRVGIKFDQSDSGSAGSWINISRCR